MAIQKLNEMHIAMTVGCFGALMHAIWAGIVFAGMGQSSLNMIFGLHFISLVTTITTFSYMEAVKLIMLGFIGGAVFGLLFAKIWNWTAGKKWAR
jgi:hypothetical protein